MRIVPLTVVDWSDFFCGAGGSSTGLKLAHPDAEVRQALNHNKIALETHARNHQTTEHYLSDVSASEPHWIPRTRCAWFSPECRYNSTARGRGKRAHKAQLELFKKKVLDPDEQRSRATAEDVLRFTECHRYDLVIVENVVEFRLWNGFDDWYQKLRNLGYETEIVYLNSMFCHPTPQSRDRLYVVAWKRGMRRPDLDIKPLALCPRCGEDVQSIQSWKKPNFRWGKYRFQYVYRCPRCTHEVTPYYYAAANIIDWSLPAQRIGDRKKPLEPKTIARIEAGLKKFGPAHLASVNYFRPNHALYEPYPTQTSGNQYGVTVPPIIVEMRNKSTARSIDEGLSTVTAHAINHALLTPPGWLVANYSPGWVKPTTEPVGSITTVDHHALLVPPYLVGYYSNDPGHQLQDPLPTVTTKDRCGMVVPPPFIMGVHTATTYRQLWEALQTVVAQGNHHFMVEPGASINVDDCGFRMLAPHEIKLGMGFDESYVVLGNKTEQVKQMGNAVTPPAAAELARRAMAILD
jgi:DNA (cytosine-5)-methyltransferase 1